VLCLAFRQTSAQAGTPRVKQVRLSTLRYFRANLRYSRHAKLEIRVTRCLLPSVVKDHSFRSIVSDRNFSAPGGAHWRFGAATAKLQTLKIKNPASSAGHVRPSALGCFLPAQPPGRICSKLVSTVPGVSNQPHLNLRAAWYVRGLPDIPGPRRHLNSIPISPISSRFRQIFFAL
jgi:hypothetical protein